MSSSQYDNAAGGEGGVYHQGAVGGAPPHRSEAAGIPLWKKIQVAYETRDAALTAYFDKRPWATRSLFVFVVVLSLTCASLMFVVITSDYGSSTHKNGTAVNTTTTATPSPALP